MSYTDLSFCGHAIGAINVISRGRRKFLAKHPLLGARSAPMPLREQQRSVYYWWWQYLRRNSPYLKCCERGGKGAMSKLYADFGDVRPADFRAWWLHRGTRLFGEAPSADSVRELHNKAEWAEDWVADTTMVVAIPLRWSKRDIKRALGKLLAQRHGRGRGRAPLRGGAASTALYPLAQNFVVHSLKRDLAVYDARLAAETEAKRTGERCKTWYRIGCELGLVPTAMPTAAERARGIADADKVNTMTVAASRAYKRAKQRVASVGRGVFP